MKYRIYALILAVFVCFAGSNAFAAYNTKSTEAIPLTSAVKTGTLPNGFKYYIKKNAKPENRGYFRIVLDGGAILENDDQNGLAHFTEHMCFNGTKNFPGNTLLDVLQKAGVRFGADINASTGLDQVMYELPIATNDPKLLKTAFQVLEDWAHNVTMDGKEIDDERGIIVGEWRQRMSAQGRLQEKFRPVEFYGSKYAERNLIGDTNFLWHFPYKAIRDFYHDWFRPDLFALVAVGDFDVNEIEKMTKEYFGKMENPKNERKREHFDIPFHSDVKACVATDPELPYEMAQVITKMPGYDVNTYAGYARQMKEQLFDMMFNQRLSDISNSPDSPFLRASGGTGGFYGDINVYYGSVISKNGGIKNALDAFYTEMARVKQHGFTKDEFERAKKDYSAQLENMLSQEPTRENDSYVDELTNYYLKKGSMGGAQFDHDYGKQILAEANLDEINGFAKNYLTDKATVILIGLPEKADASKLSESDAIAEYKTDLTKQTEAKAETASNKPLFDRTVTPGTIKSSTKDEKHGIETLVLSNGAKVILKPTKFKDNQVLLSAYSKGGSSLYDDADFYSASLATAMITEGGVGQFNKIDLQKELTGITAGVSPYIDDNYEGFQGQSNRKDMETMFQLINLYSTEPKIDKSAYNAFLERLKPQLKAKGSSQQDVFRDSCSFVLGNHAFRSQPLTMKFVEEADFDRGVQIYKERFSNFNDFTFQLVGDFDVDSAKAFFCKYIASLPTGAVENWKDRGMGFPTKAITSSAKKGVEDRAYVQISVPGEFVWSTLNRQRMRALAEVLQIKVTEIIREKLSGTYSPSVWISMHKDPKTQFSLNVQMSVSPKRVDELTNAVIDIIKEAQKNVDKVATEKVLKAEVKQREIGLKTNEFWASAIEQFTQDGETYDEVENMDKAIASCTAADLTKYAKKYLDLNRVCKIVVLPEK